MGKLLIFNFDGTTNEPDDAEQDISRLGNVEDDNITNVLKFHILCGGNLKKQKPDKTAEQISLYYQGIGTFGNIFQRLFNAGLSKEKFDVARILRQALNDFSELYDDGDKILLTGFSRGAALARRFAALISDKVNDGDIVEAVFDTVASIGLPNLSRSDRPRSEVVFEFGHTLPKKVFKALHCLSLDDKRKVFQPTLMNTEDKIHEVWFAGAHSDVGGGYYYDGLSDVVFRYMLNWVEDLGWDVKIIASSAVDYDALVDDDAGYKINQDDVSIDPNIFAENHQQSRSLLKEWATLTDRVCCVIENDEITRLKPLVHHTVAQRIAGDRNYLPRSLKGVVHEIIYDDGTRVHFNGVVVHKENDLNRLNILQKDQETKTVAFAHEKFNHTGLFIEVGCDYEISVPKLNGVEQKWRDASIECDADGWNLDDVELGAREIPIALTKPFRRVPKADWFCLCGSIGDSDDTAFEIGKKNTIKAPRSGELCLFANDLNRFYGNNFGKLSVAVKRVS